MAPQNPYFAGVAALMGDPARANILAVLLDGRARTAKELAFAAGVSPQTTSGHLAKLVDGRLLESVAQGRFRYFRLAGPSVAAAIEALCLLTPEEPRRRTVFGPAETTLRAARTCYDHLAGRLGVAVLDALLAARHLEADGDCYAVTPRGRALFAELGIEVDAVARQRRAFARPCLDWSERRPHLAGALAAALVDRCLALGWIRRLPDTRAVLVTPAGTRGLASLLSIDLAQAA
jgi:DNA-binding transcriptional ArsR family regulator